MEAKPPDAQRGGDRVKIFIHDVALLRSCREEMVGDRAAAAGAVGCRGAGGRGGHPRGDVGPRA